jgi:uncharacterized protein YkwD
MVLAHQPKSPPTLHDKKRHGQHHKPNRHYAKTYWPYLPMLLIVVLGFALNTLWSAKSKVLSYATSVSQTSLLQETNIQRGAQSRGALALNGVLSKAAQDKANDMAARNYWSHATPEGTQPWQFITAAGYNYTTAGENLAYGFDTSSAAVAGWMNSPGHRANLLNSDFKEVGFGIANNPNYQGDGEQTIIVAMYAAPEQAAAAAPVAAAPTPKAKPAVTSPAPAGQPAAASTPVQSAPGPAAQNTPTAASASPVPQQTIVPLRAQNVSRIDVLTDGNVQWLILATSVLVSLGAISFVYRHGRLWRKYLTEGEHFVIRHPVFDTAIVAMVVVTVLLTRTSGIIH